MAKKKTSKRSKSIVTREVVKLANAHYVNDEHYAAQKELNKTIKAAEKGEAAQARIEKKLAETEKKLKDAVKQAKKMKTAAKKNAAIRAREAVDKLKKDVRDAKSHTRELARSLTQAVHAVNATEAKQAAKDAAIEKFAAKWERDYDKAMAKKAKTKTKKKKTTRKKKATKKASTAVAAVTTTENSIESTPVVTTSDEGIVITD